MRKYPLLLRPVSKSTIWGGNLLKKEYGKDSSLENIAESWELTVRESEKSIISCGEYKGTLLQDYISQNRIGVLGTNAEKYDRFPILIKFIDAAADLSIQVHPDNYYSLKNHNELGKTEMWYIVKAKENSKIIYGLRSDYERADLLSAIENGRAEELLNYVPVHQGDVFFIPPGQVHAIGAGILVAEIQQNSDITYRLYDYNRRQADGTTRHLHIKEALDVIKKYSDNEIRNLQFSKTNFSSNNDVLCSCEYFTAIRHRTENSLTLTSDEKSFVSVLVIESDGAVISDGTSDYPLRRGESYFIPAGMGDFSVLGKCEFISTTVN